MNESVSVNIQGRTYNFTKRQAIAAVRAEADYLIEQAQRIAKGWDKGRYRSDDAHRHETIAQRIAFSIEVAFTLSAAFADPDERHIQRHEADKAAQDNADDITG